MKPQDRRNLIRGWPVYLLFAVLLLGMILLYSRNLSRHGNEPLSDLIAKNLKGSARSYQDLDEVINRRETWQPVLPDWQGKELPDLPFERYDGRTGKLSDYAQRQMILVIGATWYPPFRMQLQEFQRLGSNTKNDGPVLLALTIESSEAIGDFLHKNAFSCELGSVHHLPEPYGLPDGFPCVFFIDSQRRLKLAAVGLIPLSHARAIVSLSGPQP